jgi:hypothetical protein
MILFCSVGRGSIEPTNSEQGAAAAATVDFNPRQQRSRQGLPFPGQRHATQNK